MTTPGTPEARPVTPVEKIRTALLGYRVMAWTTGIWLIALCYEIVVHYVVKVPNPPTWIGVVHGWVYFTYVLAAFNLAVKVRWPVVKTIGVLLAGTIPLVGDHRRALPDQGRQGPFRSVAQRNSCVSVPIRLAPAAPAAITQARDRDATPRLFPPDSAAPRCGRNRPE